MSQVQTPEIQTIEPAETISEPVELNEEELGLVAGGVGVAVGPVQGW